MKIILLLFAYNSLSYAGDNLLFKYCKKYNGELHEKFTCPKTQLTFSFGFCVFHNNDNIKQFFDGCTGPSGGFEERFYPHCIKHDLCYHHEPISNGKKKSQCDREFHDGLLSSCSDLEGKRFKSCQRWSGTLYNAVRFFGRLAFNCANYEGKY